MVHAPKLKVNGFVRTTDDYGLGKLIEVKGGQGRVRFWHSTVATEERWYPLTTLQRGGLAPQMRAFWSDPRQTVWRAGRVRDCFVENDDYLTYTVRFPNGDDRDLSERDLETRTQRPNSDPAEALAGGWCETQFFYDRRLAALMSLIHARASSMGLTGLTSAAIELLPHQVEVVRRVLADPLQRYLLADEVGLGKTIEAGCIIRQGLLDSPTERTVVLAPVSLVRQWEQELTGKFGIDEFPGRVIVRSFDSLWDLQPDAIDTLVVDEAHHLVGRAMAGEDAASSKQYQRLLHLARSCQRLFILSATPVLGDEEAMLRLLHLLDPQAHPLEDRAGFQRKLANRQEYGRLLMALNPKAPPFILKRLGAQVLETFPGDEVIAALAPKLITPGPDAQATSAADIVGELKSHIAETYRLHQRLLRTRRKDLPEWELLPREGRIELVSDPAANVSLLLNGLEDWRYYSQVTAQRQSDPAAIMALESAFARRFIRMFEAMGQGAEVLAAELDRQQEEVNSGRQPTFGEEPEIVRNLRRAFPEESNPPRQSALAANAIKKALADVKRPTGAPKVVAFTSSRVFANQLAADLARVMGRSAICLVAEGLSADAVEQAVERIKGSNQPTVLICDQSGEEGLNLHFVDAVVHLDLPLAPDRLEQRIGRVDRFGRRGSFIRHVLLLPSVEPGSPWLAWHTLLHDGFQIYNNSISDVQFLLEGVQERLTVKLYREGAPGLAGAAGWVQQELEKERARLDEQYALDQLTLVDEESSPAFQALEEWDDGSLYEDLNRWVVEALLFRRRPASPVPQEAFRLEWTEETLVPNDPSWRDVFGPALHRSATYDRGVAVHHPGIRLIRPGSVLVESIQRHLLWEDRGTSFATWRVDPRWNTEAHSEWIGFRLTFVVEFDIDRVTQLLSGRVDPTAIPAIRRRADALFPPWIESLTLDALLREVTDGPITEILAEPYRAHDKGGHDHNLGNRRELMFALVPPNHFSGLCKRVRERSEELVWGSARFCEMVDKAARQARSELLIRNEHLGRRNAALRRLEGTPDPTVDQEVAINQVIFEAVGSPRVRLDAIGFFVISDRPPERSGA